MIWFSVLCFIIVLFVIIGILIWIWTKTQIMNIHWARIQDLCQSFPSIV